MFQILLFLDNDYKLGKKIYCSIYANCRKWNEISGNSFPYCAWSFFTKKFFLGFLFGSTSGTPKQYLALKQEEQMFLWGMTDLPVAIRWSLLRRKEEGKLKAFENIPRRRKEKYLLGCSGSRTLSLAFIEVYSRC